MVDARAYCENMYSKWYAGHGWAIVRAGDGIEINNPAGVKHDLYEESRDWVECLEKYPGTTQRLWSYSLNYLVDAHKISPRHARERLVAFYDGLAEIRSTVRKRLGESWDHCVSMRLRALTALTGSGDAEMEKLAKNYIEVEKNSEDLWALVVNNNHGLMLVQSLVEAALGRYTDSPSASEAEIVLGSVKLEEIVRSVFGADFYCNENSPFYHHFYIDRFKYMRQAFDGVQLLSQTVAALDRWIALAEKSMRGIVTSDGIIPPLGDSTEMRSPYPPSKGTFFSTRTGFWVHKNDEIYVSLKCGHDSVVHKHADDTSIYVRCNGETFIGDGGTHSYDYSDKRVFTLRTQKAHSGVFFKEYDEMHSARLYKGPRYNTKDWTKGRIYEPTMTDVRGVVNVGGGGMLERHLTIVDERTFKVADRCISFDQLTPVHRFLVPGTIGISIEGHIMILRGEKGLLKVTFDRPVKAEIAMGEYEHPYRGWYSPKPNIFEVAQMVEVVGLDNTGTLNFECNYVPANDSGQD